MNIKKLSGSLAVAVSVLALNGVVVAEEHPVTACYSSDEDPSVLGADSAIMELSDWVTCETAVDDIWISGDDFNVDSIWQFGRSKKNGSMENGCTVHAKVNALLFEERDEADPNTTPPWKGKKNGKNGPKGAYHALMDGNPTYAADLLGEVVRVLDESANVKEDDRQPDEDDIRDRAFDVQQAIYYHCF